MAYTNLQILRPTLGRLHRPKILSSTFSTSTSTISPSSSPTSQDASETNMTPLGHHVRALVKTSPHRLDLTTTKSKELACGRHSVFTWFKISTFKGACCFFGDAFLCHANVGLASASSSSPEALSSTVQQSDHISARLQLR